MLIARHSERSQSAFMSGFFVSGSGLRGEGRDVRSGEAGGGGDRIDFCLRLRLCGDRRADSNVIAPMQNATVTPAKKMHRLMKMFQKATTIAQSGVTGSQWTILRNII